MNGKVCWVLAVAALWSASVNAEDAGVVVLRGQSPASESESTTTSADVSVEAYGPLIGSAPGYGEFSKSKKKDFKVFSQKYDNNFGYEGGYYTGPDGYYTSHGKKIYTTGSAAQGGCPHCQYGQSCPPSGCMHCQKQKPTHYTTYQHKWPENLVYPQYGAPAGAVQYPYYIFRGPTDFFMK